MSRSNRKQHVSPTFPTKEKAKKITTLWSWKDSVGDLFGSEPLKTGTWCHTAKMLQAKQKEYDELEIKFQELRTEHTKLEIQLKACKLASSWHKEAASRDEREADKKMAQLTTLRGSERVLSDYICNKEGFFNELVKEGQRVSMEKVDEIKRLNKQLQVARKQHRHFCMRIEKVQAESAQLVKTKQAAEDEVSDLKEAIQAMKDELADLEAKVYVRCEVLDSLDTLVDVTKQKLHQTRTAVSLEAKKLQAMQCRTSSKSANSTPSTQPEGVALAPQSLQGPGKCSAKQQATTCSSVQRTPAATSNSAVRVTAATSSSAERAAAAAARHSSAERAAATAARQSAVAVEAPISAATDTTSACDANNDCMVSSSPHSEQQQEPTRSGFNLRVDSRYQDLESMVDIDATCTVCVGGSGERDKQLQGGKLNRNSFRSFADKARLICQQLVGNSSSKRVSEAEARRRSSNNYSKCNWPRKRPGVVFMGMYMGRAPDLQLDADAPLRGSKSPWASFPYK